MHNWLVSRCVIRGNSIENERNIKTNIIDYEEKKTICDSESTSGSPDPVGEGPSARFSPEWAHSQIDGYRSGEL